MFTRFNMIQEYFIADIQLMCLIQIYNFKYIIYENMYTKLSVEMEKKKNLQLVDNLSREGEQRRSLALISLEIVAMKITERKNLKNLTRIGTESNFIRKGCQN